MAVRYHGRRVTFEEVRQVVGAGARGTNLKVLGQAAEYYGLAPEAVSASADALRYLPPGTILHWDREHFVVLERWTSRGVWIADPALGRRRYPHSETAACFSGTALLLSPGPLFCPSAGQQSNLRRFGRQILGASRNPLAGLITISLLVQGAGLIGPYLTGVMIDRVVPSHDYALLTAVAAGLVAFVGSQFIITFARARVLLRLRIGVDAVLTRKFMAHLSRLPWPFFQRHTTGDLLMRVYSNSSVRGALTSGLLSGLLDTCMVSVYLVLLFRASFKLTILVLLVASIQLVLMVNARRRRAELSAQTIRMQAQSQNHDVEMLLGIETLKAMGAEERAVERWAATYDAHQQIMIRQSLYDSWFDAVQGAVRMASPMLLLLFGAVQVMEQRMTLGQMFAFNAIAGSFLGPLSGLTGLLASLNTVDRQLERLDDVLSETPEPTGSGTYQPVLLTGKIVAHSVSFRYGPLSPLVVDDVSFVIEPGQFVAIVGRSGSGKSTLGRLLLGLCTPTSGRILYDGRDLRSLDVSWLRRQIGVVTQSVQLFGDTVAANIALADPRMPRAQIIEAAQRAQIHEEILALPHGYDSVLGARGASLSGGQQQRLALARAVASRPRLLLLDEASNQLDPIAEALVLESLTETGCTRILIAHRLASIASADLILVMDHGRISQAGRHHELLLAGGVYASLVNAGSLAPTGAGSVSR